MLAESEREKERSYKLIYTLTGSGGTLTLGGTGVALLFHTEEVVYYSSPSRKGLLCVYSTDAVCGVLTSPSHCNFSCASIYCSAFDT